MGSLVLLGVRRHGGVDDKTLEDHDVSDAVRDDGVQDDGVHDDGHTQRDDTQELAIEHGNIDEHTQLGDIEELIIEHGHVDEHTQLEQPEHDVILLLNIDVGIDTLREGMATDSSGCCCRRCRWLGDAIVSCTLRRLPTSATVGRCP